MISYPQSTTHLYTRNPVRLQGVTDTSPLYGYVRASSDKQVLSPQTQKERLANAALALEPALAPRLAEWIDNNIFDEGHTSATEVPWDERPAFLEMLDKLESGDRLLIWRWDRIERNQFRAPAALEQLILREARLYILQHGVREFNIDTPTNVLIAIFLQAIGGHENELRTEAAMHAKRRLRAQGIIRHGNPIYGYRREARPDGRGSTRYFYNHDEHERVVIRQCFKRNLSGESEKKITKSLNAAGVLTAEGKPWEKTRLQRVFQWLRACEKLGLEPWVDCVPCHREPTRLG